MSLTFKKFVENKKEYYIKNKKLFLETEDGYKKIARSYIYITNIRFKKAYLDDILLKVDFNYYNPLNQDIEDGNLYIKVSFTGKIVSFDYGKSRKDIFIEVIKSTYVEEYKLIILKLYKEYFQEFIFKYIKKYPTILAKCGWYKNWHKIGFWYRKEFLSITERNYYPNFVKDLFDGNVNKHKKLTDFFSKLCKNNNSTGNLFEFIVSDPCILTVFAYSIHAISWDYVYDYLPVTSSKEIGTVFSLCIYGNEISASNKIANLLSNFFTVKPNMWTVISRKYHISETSSKERKFPYVSIPIIITSKNNHFTRTSNIVQNIYREREENKLHIYPVYISSSSIVGDEMLNCCSDSLSLQFKKVNIGELREQFIGLICNYISYLSNMSTILQNRGKYKLFIKEYGEEEIIKKILYNNLDMPLFKDKLNTFFSEQSLTYSLVKEWLDNYSLDKEYNLNLKRCLLKKWLEQCFLENSYTQQDISPDLCEMLLEKIIEEWDFVECDHEINISEEALQDSDLREKYKFILEQWKYEQTEFNNWRKELLINWIHMHFAEFRLYQTMDAFCSYLEDVSLTDVAIKIKNYAEKCFLPQVQNESSEPSQSELNYLNLLCSFIKESLNDSKNESWIWKGQEPRVEKEYCYYLYYKVGLEKFNEFLLNASCNTLGKQEFDHLLKKGKILKLPKGTSNTWKRKGMTVYIIKKEKIDKFSE